MDLTKAADPLNLFKGKGDPLGAAKWAQNNPQYAIPIAAAVAAPFTGGASLGLMGAGAAGTAGAIGASEAAAAAAPALTAGTEAAIGSALPGGAAGAFDMFGSAFPGVAGAADAAGGGAAELASVGATHSPMFYGMGGSAVGNPSSGLMGIMDKVTPGNVNRGMKAYNTFNQMTGQNQQQRPMAAPAAPPQQTPYQPVAPIFGAGQGMGGGPDSAQMMMLKRLGLA